MSTSRWCVHHDHKSFLHVHSKQNAQPSKVLTTNGTGAKARSPSARTLWEW